MKNTDFLDASAYLRVQEKRLLTAAALERAAETASIKEALRMLSQNSDYDFTSQKGESEYEDSLKAELARVYTLAYSLTEHTCLVDILACKYDYHNLKAALKAKHFPQRTANPYIAVTKIEPARLERLFEDGIDPLKTELPMHLIEAAAAMREAFAKADTPQSIDIAADKAMFAHMLTLAAQTDSEFIVNYVKTAIDFYNIKALVRVKDMKKGTAFLSDCLANGGLTATDFFVENYSKTLSAMLPVFYYKYFGDAMRLGVESYERTGNFSQLERMLDNLLVQYTKQARYITYGAEILFVYLLSKENEIRQVRILVTCKRNEIAPEALKERLRDNYA